MSLLERLQDDLKEAMRASETMRRDTIRLVISALKLKAIDGKQELDEGEEFTVLKKEVKNRRDSIEQYEAANREDLAAIERAEIDVLEPYLPEEMSAEQVREIVQAAIQQLGATSKKEMGKVMQTVMAEHKGQVDGKVVQQCANELLV